MSVYQIEDKPVIKIAKYLYIGYITVDAFKNAWYNVILKNDRDEVILSEVITMTPEEYAQWGNNDDYILQLTCEKLGVVIKHSSNASLLP